MCKPTSTQKYHKELQKVCDTLTPQYSDMSVLIICNKTVNPDIFHFV